MQKAASNKIAIKVSVFQSLPIFEQLHLEESLVRDDTSNWCLVNVGTRPAIVFGISEKIEDVLSSEYYSEKKLPLIRRFSGGGTVVVDEGTLFITFIFRKKDINLGDNPKAIMAWTEELYSPLFSPHNFRLEETDYVIGEKKIGGNAQYITKNSWLHHTSFLWDFQKERMALLNQPKKAPKYRGGRAHENFLCPLSSLFSDRDAFIEGCMSMLKERFLVEETKDIPTLPSGSRRTTSLILI
jgi:lipoate---protein ligase